METANRGVLRLSGGESSSKESVFYGVGSPAKRHWRSDDDEDWPATKRGRRSDDDSSASCLTEDERRFPLHDEESTSCVTKVEDQFPVHDDTELFTYDEALELLDLDIEENQQQLQEVAGDYPEIQGELPGGFDGDLDLPSLSEIIRFDDDLHLDQGFFDEYSLEELVNCLESF